jgi:hypothetical protein
MKFCRKKFNDISQLCCKIGKTLNTDIVTVVRRYWYCLKKGLLNEPPTDKIDIWLYYRITDKVNIVRNDYGESHLIVQIRNFSLPELLLCTDF